VLGAAALEHLLGETYLPAHYFGLFDGILLRESSVWFRGATREEVYRQAAAASLAGPTIPWGEVQKVEFKHLLFGDKLPAWLGFNRGPFPMPGSRGSVMQVQRFRFGGRDSAPGPAFRMVTDLAKDAIHTALAGGPSDRRFSKWYVSGLADWLAGKRKTIEGPS
jgi:penicillin amidase